MDRIYRNNIWKKWIAGDVTIVRMYAKTGRREKVKCIKKYFLIYQLLIERENLENQGLL